MRSSLIVGGTEGDNTAILETAFSRQKEGRHLITTAIEHPAVLNTMKYLETKGFDVTYLPVDEKGNLSIEEIKKSVARRYDLGLCDVREQ